MHPSLYCSKIARFRNNFFEQKKKIRNLHVDQVTTENENFPGNVTDKRPPNTFVYVNESLTPEGKELLSLARARASERGYKFRGWTVKGNVRVRKAEDSPIIDIRSKRDLVKIL